MPSPEEQAYSAVERAYGQANFERALELAEALQPQLEPDRSDLLDQRLQLLIGHIHLYGLAQPRQAKGAYEAVLERCHEPNYRQLAEQSLQLCTATEPEPPALSTTAAATASELPATPWLQQLHDPQQALAQIQVPAASPPAAVVAAAREAASPWSTPVPAALETAERQASATEPSASTAEPELAAPKPIADSASPAPPAPSELERGLLLVRLSSQARPTAENGAEPPSSLELPSKESSWKRLKERWRRGLSPRQRSDGGGSDR